jgi:hypothetical protein
MKKVRFLGLDVHAETIAVAIAEPDGELRSLGTIPNREEPIRKLVKKLGKTFQEGKKRKSTTMEGRAGSGRAARGTENPHRFLCDRPLAGPTFLV